MKFTIQKKHLLNSIQQVTTAISSRTVIPILTGMKLEVTEGKLILTGSNSDITIQSHILQKVEDEEIITNITPGSIVLPVPHFPEIIKKLPEDIVEITVEDNYKTIIKSGKAIFNLNGQSTEEYPHVMMDQSDDAINIKVADLKTLIRQTVFAVSTMETRPILTGINITSKDDKVTFTATDSHRLALRTISLPQAIDEMNIVIPGKSLQELNKVMDDGIETINISIMQNQILFYTDYLYFSSRLLNGNYPETSRLIPKESNTVIHADTRSLIQTIERAALLSNRDQNNVINLSTKPGNILDISSNSPEVGNVKEDLVITSIEGEELNISFSAKYMLDTLRTIDSEEIQINFTGTMRPFVIKIPNNNSVLQLILPVRTY